MAMTLLHKDSRVKKVKDGPAAQYLTDETNGPDVALATPAFLVELDAVVARQALDC